MLKNKTMKSIGLFVFGVLSGFVLSFLFINYHVYSFIILSLLFGSLAALTSFFLDFAFREGNIFSFWIRFLNKYVYERSFSFLYKPLGGCSLCMNQWISIFYFLLAWRFVDLSFWFLIPLSLISHVVLFLLLKHFDLED